MKRIWMVVLLVVLAASAVQAQGLYIIPSASVDLGTNNYFRGGAATVQAIYDFGLAIGLEAKADYDLTFSVFDVPVLLTIGVGKGFWIGAGYTFAVGSPTLLINSTAVAWKVGNFPIPDTYEIGGNLFAIPVGIGTLTFPTTISYTMNGPVNASDPLSQSLGSLIGFLVGLKATIGVGLELKPF